MRQVLILGLAAAAAVELVAVPVAHACGCFSPPAVAVTASDYAINQSAEQILFEVEPGWVTAHVLIRYVGDPAQFAWLVPVPEAPELGISPVSAFGLLDRATAPNVSVSVQDICPTSEWACQYEPSSGSSGVGCGGASAKFGGIAISDAGAFASDAVGAPPVTVINEQVVGDYQTVTFAASDAAAATQWLRDNGFIVNDTTSIYMESYIQANMVFVAAKLVPGANTSAIKPLRMRYRAAYPTIPLILTAVAAQPNLTVTAFVFSDQPYRPMGHPVVTIAADRLAVDTVGRFNYPMVLARTIDEAGGDGFAIEYRGYSSPSTVGTGPCCGGGQEDFCGLGNDGQCECPADAFDQADCASQSDLVAGVALLDTLGSTYSSLTRITTRISPEEMTFDPAFEPDVGAVAFGAMTVQGTQATLTACSTGVIDQPTYAQIQARQTCSAMYCGTNGQCAATAAGPACVCGAGSVAQRFVDLDGVPSVTCVPTVPPVDLRAGGDVLPDACVGVSCGDGQCIDRNGVAVCACAATAAATTYGGPSAPLCVPIQVATQSPGAENFSGPLRALAVCAPAPPSCGDDGWLVKVGSSQPGVDCGYSTPPDSLTEPKSTSGFGCGCQQSDPSPLVFMSGAGLVFALVVRKRRRAR